MGRSAIAPIDPDTALRQAALQRAWDLQQAFREVVPLKAIREGFIFAGERISFGSFQKGIHRAKEQQGPAALSLTTAPAKPGRDKPYDDVVDLDSGAIVYHYRVGSPDQPDNRALRAARELETPLIYFWGIDPGQYQVSVDARRYRLTQVAARYHQARFRRDVLRAYRDRCAVCSLRERQLVEASHIIRDTDPAGIAAVINGIALCAIHHLAYDRNLLGIDPAGVVHIGERLLREVDGPMLSSGIQGFHGAAILQPREPQSRPDPARLAVRFDEFEAAA